MLTFKIVQVLTTCVRIATSYQHHLVFFATKKDFWNTKHMHLFPEKNRVHMDMSSAMKRYLLRAEDDQIDVAGLFFLRSYRQQNC